MAMIKRGTGKIDKYTDASGEEVSVEAKENQESVDANLVWADEKIKDAIDVNTVNNIYLNVDDSNDDDETIAKDC